MQLAESMCKFCKNRSRQQVVHADVLLGDGFGREDISRLAVTGIISVHGPPDTMVYPRTVGKVRYEEDLDGISCIRATESDNRLLFDAASAHKGAANYSGEPTFKIIITFMNNAASKQQTAWLIENSDIKTLLNLSVNEFLCQGLRATDCESEAATGSAAAAVSSAARYSQEATHSVVAAASTAAAAAADAACGTADGGGGGTGPVAAVEMISRRAFRQVRARGAY